MTFAEEIEAGLAELEAEIPDTITWNSTSYAITPGSKTKSGALEVGGLEISFDFSCTIRRSLFTTLPKKGQTLTHGSDVLRIESVIEAGGNSHIRLLCVAQNRGV